jgi:hypothetical protein
MITKTQWLRYCKDVARIRADGYDVWIKDKLVLFVSDNKDAISVSDAGNKRYIEYKHPDSFYLNPDLSLDDLYFWHTRVKTKPTEIIDERLQQYMKRHPRPFNER